MRSSTEHIWDAWGMISRCLVPPLPRVSGRYQALTYCCSVSSRDKIQLAIKKNLAIKKKRNEGNDFLGKQ